MKLGVEQRLQAITTAPHSTVVEFYFEGLEFLKQGGHGQCVLCELTFELSGRQRRGVLDSKRKMGRRPSA